jgi:dGTPase
MGEVGGAYNTEKVIFNWVRGTLGDERRSLEAELMDWADDITYSIHDVVDFYCAGLIPLHLLVAERSEERSRVLRGFFARKNIAEKDRPKWEAALSETLAYFSLDRHFVGSDLQRQHLYRFMTRLITQFASALRLNPDAVSGKSEPRVLVNSEARLQVEVLKQLNWHYVILRSSLAHEQEGQRKAVRDSFESLLHAAESGRIHILPQPYGQRWKLAIAPAPKTRKHPFPRIIADCIASMSESELMRAHAELTGRQSQPGRHLV